MGRNRPKKGKSVKNNPNRGEVEPDELARAPHSFVIHRGSVGRTIVDFTKDFRRVMDPFTASSLKVRKKNSVKDFVAVAGMLHVSDLVMFTSTETSSYVRFGRFPRGPTLTFRMLKYSLSRDVLSQIKKQYVFDKAFQNFPLVVLNNFSGEGAHMKLMATMFQNMFPTINITKINLDTVRRCVMFNYNHEDKTVDFRHYGIRVTPVGLSRTVKKLVQSKVPSLGRYDDVSEFVLRGDVSESEAEDDGTGHVTLPQNISSRGNFKDGQSAIRLCELGPRMTLQLIKVEGGLCEGEVIYHDLVKKSEEEIALINKRRVEKRRLKEQRKMQQERNKKEKERQKELLKQKSLDGIERRKKELLSKKSDLGEGDEVESDRDNDSEYYKQEVGEDPDKDLFTHTKSKGMKRKSTSKEANIPHKKHKFNHNEVKSKDKDFRNGKQNHNKRNGAIKSHAPFKKNFSKNPVQQRRKKNVIGSKVRNGKRH